jgi:hypothetical protein
MNIILGERGSGKTRTLIEMASKDDDSYLVVKDKRTADEVFRKAKSENFEINFPLTYDELFAGRKNYGRGVRYSIIIDDVNLFIKHICGGAPLIGMSLNIDFGRDNVVALNKTKISSTAKELIMLKCEDCGLPYSYFGLDTTLSNFQWSAIHPESNNGILCAKCMVARASKLPGIIAARMVFEFAPHEAVEQSAQRIGLWARISRWFGAIANR